MQLSLFAIHAFQSTLSMRRATAIRSPCSAMCRFQSTLSMRRATVFAKNTTPKHKFQSTLSMRRATRRHAQKQNKAKFQSTLSMRRATLRVRVIRSYRLISIHALHEESDGVPPFDERLAIISIHALHEESDEMITALPHPSAFQSTLSMRRATLSNQQTMQFADIFQSTLSMRRATANSFSMLSSRAISIHALHEESDR